MKERVELIANLVFVAVALVIGYVSVRSYLRQGPGRNVEAELRGAVKQGDQLARISGYEWNLHPRTLVLALRKDCHFCEASMPFYQQLARLEESHQTDVHLLAVFPDDAKDVRALIASQKLDIHALSNVSLETIKVRGTPTLILADQLGRVIKVWVGELPSEGEKYVLAAILKASPQ